MAQDTFQVAFFVGFMLLVAAPMVYFFGFVIPRKQRRAVEEEVEAQGGRVVAVRQVWFFSLIAERNTRRWEVEFIDSAGRTHTARAQTSIVTGFRWLTGPYA